MDKAFINHKANGVNLTFPNGNSISTIWGVGSYTDNHNYSTGNPIKDYETPIKAGSNTAEVMITAPYKLNKKIHLHQGSHSYDDVIGWVSITDWVWIINQLSKEVKHG